MLEFALILPVLLIVAMLILDLGRVFWYFNTLTNAVREGARYGSVHPEDTTAIEQVVIDFTVNVGATPGVSIDPDGKYITVTATHIFEPVSPIGALITGGGGYELSTQSTMHIEGAGY